MSVPQQLARHLSDAYFGGNWTWVNMKDTLSDVTWQEATTRVYDCNTIAVLVYHINYYTAVQIKVLQGSPLDAHDKYSFDCPPVNSQQDWEKMLAEVLDNATVLATLVKQLPAEKAWEYFTDEKYGTYYRNIQGNTEHIHYHLGQVVILKKVIRGQNNVSSH